MSPHVMYGILGSSYVFALCNVSLLCLLTIFLSRGYLLIMCEILFFLSLCYLLLVHIKSKLLHTTIAHLWVL